MFTKCLALAVAGIACLVAASHAPDPALTGFPENGFSYIDILEYWKGQGAQPQKTEGEGNATTHYWSFDRDQYDTAIRNINFTGGIETRSPVGTFVPFAPRDSLLSRSESWYYKILCDETGTRWGNAVVASILIGDVCQWTISAASHQWVVRFIEKKTTLRDENNRLHNVYLKVGWVWEKIVNTSSGGACAGALALLINDYCKSTNQGNVAIIDNSSGSQIARGTVEIRPA